MTDSKQPVPEGQKGILELSALLMWAYPDKDKFISPAESQWAMAWLRQVPEGHPNFKSNTHWNQDLIKLGIIHPLRPLNQKRMMKVSTFIWERRGETPEFQKLYAYLSAEDAVGHKLVEYRLTEAKKKNKLKRKQVKLKRRRGKR